MIPEKIRVLVVDDSKFRRNMVCDILNTDSEIEVVGCAENGVEAVEKTIKLNPNVITLDINMPKMGGYETIEEIMLRKPTPILVVSTVIQNEQNFVVKCMEHGALDFVPIRAEIDIVAEELVEKVKICSRIKVVTHTKPRPVRFPKASLIENKEYEIIGIAISTGGPVALFEVLKRLPGKLLLPIVVVQHISEGFTEGLAEWLNDECRINVQEATAGDKLKHDIVYIAPSGYHLNIGPDKRIKLSKEDIPQHPHKPSGDVMLKSIADVYGSNAIGLIMTGMGRDGVAGIKAIKEAGGYTIAQDEKSSVIYGMNKVAVDEGIIREVLPLDQLAKKLIRLSKKD